MIFIKNRTILALIQGKQPQNTKFLTENQHGSHKSRVLICNINTPLIPRICCKCESVCSPLLCYYSFWIEAPPSEDIYVCTQLFTLCLPVHIAYNSSYSIQQFIQYRIVHIVVYNSSYSIRQCVEYTIIHDMRTGTQFSTSLQCKG